MIISSILRLLPSFLASPVGSQLAKTGKDIVSDLAAGSDVKSTLKNRSREAVKNMTGIGRKRKHPKQQGGSKMLGFLRGRVMEKEKQKGRRKLFIPST